MQKIEFDVDYVEGFSGWEGTAKGTLRSDGWSFTAENGGGLRPNLIYFKQFDLEILFNGIDLSTVETWDIKENDSINVLDVAHYDLNLKVFVNNKPPVEVNYEGISFEESLICNVDDACNFIDTFFSVFQSLDSESPIVIPNILSLMGILFLTFSVLMPLRYSKQIGERNNNSLIISFEVVALYVDFNLIFAVVMYITPSLGFIEFLVAFIVSVTLEFSVFKIYYKKLWGLGKQEIPKEK